MAQISLIMPVYNAGAALEGAVRHLFAQSFTDWELILVDDGSTDGSSALCDRLAEQDARVCVCHQENAGAGPARNRGMALATAPFWAFPDADDTMEPTYLEVLYTAITIHNADIAVCGFSETPFGRDWHTGKTLCPDAAVFSGTDRVRAFFMAWYPDGMAGYLWNKLYRAAPIRENTLRFPALRRYQDGAFNVAVFDKATAVVTCDACLYHYGLNDVETAYRKFPRDKLELMRAMLTVYEQTLATWDGDKRVADERICSFWLRGVVSCLDCLFNPAWGLDAAGRRAYLRAVREDERVIRDLPRRTAYGKYPDLLLSLLEERHFLLIRAAVFCKIALKRHAQSLFLRLKREGG